MGGSGSKSAKSTYEPRPTPPSPVSSSTNTSYNPSLGGFYFKPATSTYERPTTPPTSLGVGTSLDPSLGGFYFKPATSTYERRTTPPTSLGVGTSLGVELEDSWRKIKWGEKAELEQKLRNFKISYPHIPYVRILLVGAVGAGKSSFINSVNNAFQGRITCEALTATGSGQSFTTNYTTHYIENEDGSPLPFVFNDIMGLEADSGGVQTQDIVSAVQGFIQEGYKFNPASVLSSNDSGYRSNPTLEEQTFCLVNIIETLTVSQNTPLFEKLKYIRGEATKLNMPQVIIMTKPDLACPLVKKDLRKIYNSKKIKEKMQECSNLIGIPMNYIFPVKNYHEEIDTNADMDLLVLKALDQIVSNANDAMKKKRSKPGSKQE